MDCAKEPIYEDKMLMEVIWTTVSYVFEIEYYKEKNPGNVVVKKTYDCTVHALNSVTYQYMFSNSIYNLFHRPQWGSSFKHKTMLVILEYVSCLTICLPIVV